eukprot:gene10005-10871_t
MSFIDALPGIDKDNEDPVLRDEVTRLIEEEMKTFPEKRDELLSRKGLFLDNEVNDLVSKIEQRGNTILLPKIIHSTEKYESITSLPTDNLKEWEEKINQLKILYSHSENQLLNLELAESHASKPYLTLNSTLDASHHFYNIQTKEHQKSIYELQKQRRELQERLLPQLNKLLKRKNDSLGRKLSCDYATIQLKSYLKMKGFDYEEYVKEKELATEKSTNPHDQRFNSTVREYETVNEVVVEDVDDESDEEKKEGERTKKRSRKH